MPVNYTRKARFYIPMDDGKWMEIVGHMPAVSMQQEISPDRLPTITIDAELQRAEVKLIESSALPTADNYADWERMILNGVQ